MPTRCITTGIASAFTALILVAPLQADPAADRKAIAASYAKADAALARKDLKALFADYDPQYEQVGPDGSKANLEQAKQVSSQMLATLQNPKSKTDIQKITFKGSAATAWIKGRLEWKMTNPQTNKLTHIVGQADAVDTWVKTAKGWRLKRSKISNMKMTVDGKPMTMPQ